MYQQGMEYVVVNITNGTNLLSAGNMGNLVNGARREIDATIANLNKQNKRVINIINLGEVPGRMVSFFIYGILWETTYGNDRPAVQNAAPPKAQKNTESEATSSFVSNEKPSAFSYSSAPKVQQLTRNPNISFVSGTKPSADENRCAFCNSINDCTNTSSDFYYCHCVGRAICTEFKSK